VSEVEVFYIDYGNHERVTVDRLRPLPPDLLELPAQAFMCSLSKVLGAVQHLKSRTGP
jgi:hypothetical protein